MLKAIWNKWLPYWAADLEYTKESRKKEEEKEEEKMKNNKKNICGDVNHPDCNSSIGIYREKQITGRELILRKFSYMLIIVHKDDKTIQWERQLLLTNDSGTSEYS